MRPAFREDSENESAYIAGGTAENDHKPCDSGAHCQGCGSHTRPARDAALPEAA
jgi:uncharacterized protein YecA (UPF0149 family)